jgi:phosphatidylglycerol:prolipoprotein diacylglycerol transferase
MFPEIDIGFLGKLRLMTVMAAIGISVMLILVRIETKKAEKSSPFKEGEYIFPKLMIAAFGGYFGALLYDAAFKVAENGYFRLEGISFYGGLIGGVMTIYIAMLVMPVYTSFTKLEWLDKLTIPFVCFHFFGRIGCFLSGCCYGKETESPLGVYFLDQPEYGVFHHGNRVYPTQLFEVVALAVIAALLLWVLKKHRFMNYLILYPVFRFLIEFLRGDDRGISIFTLSPAQVTSAVIIIIPITFYIKMIIDRNKTENKTCD